jgi:hypothetical protein
MGCGTSPLRSYSALNNTRNYSILNNTSYAEQALHRHLQKACVTILANFQTTFQVTGCYLSRAQYYVSRI